MVEGANEGVVHLSWQASDRKPSLLVRRFRAAGREVCWRMSHVLPLILAAEFPKSGGTWIAQMIASAAGYRFPRNNLAPHFRRAVLLGHHRYSRMYDNVFVIYRDGRDVMVSAYHHFLFENEWNDAGHVESVRRELGYKDGDEPYHKFNDFVEWMFTGYCRRRMRFSWAEFVRSWIDRDVPGVRYEDMLAKPVFELGRLCLSLELDVETARLEAIVDENSFKAQARKAPEGSTPGSFARKGIAGDWKNIFDPTSSEIFRHFAGDELIALGYESDNDWSTPKGAGLQYEQSR